MTSREIVEQNVAISAFMDLIDPQGPDWHLSPLSKGWCHEMQLAYHRDWNWLMTVVDKIDSLKIEGGVVCQTHHTSHMFYIHYNWSPPLANHSSVTYLQHPSYKEGRLRPSDEDRIQNVFLAIVDFIIWFNDNKPVTQNNNTNA